MTELNNGVVIHVHTLTYSTISSHKYLYQVYLLAASKPGRGRHRHDVLLKVFLLDRQRDEVPTPREQRRLTEKGLG